MKMSWSTIFKGTIVILAGLVATVIGILYNQAIAQINQNTKDIGNTIQEQAVHEKSDEAVKEKVMTLETLPKTIEEIKTTVAVDKVQNETIIKRLDGIDKKLDIIISK